MSQAHPYNLNIPAGMDTPEQVTVVGGGDASAANQTALLVLLAKAATATLSNVASSATNVTLLALNANRKGVTIYNDSTAVLYVKLGTTASATSYTIQMTAGSYYEVPFGYNGRIDGIWASANGNARITEFT